MTGLPANAEALEARIAEGGEEYLVELADRLGEGDEVGMSGRDFADASDRGLARGGRAAAGTHATPWPLARWLAEQLAAGAEATVLDPACGTGHLLVAAASRRLLPARRWVGWDISPGRVAATRVALWLAHGSRGAPRDFARIERCDALLGAPETRADVVIANPPFVSIRELARSWPAGYADRLRAAEPDLAGSFDLYVPFLLKLSRWLAAGGRFGVIVPATVWSAAYADPARRWLADHLVAAHRIAGRGVFPEAAVTTHVLMGGRARRGTARLYRTHLPASRATEPPRVESVLDGECSAADLRRAGYPGDELRPGRPTRPLGDVATIAAGTAGYQAHAVAGGLREAGLGDDEPEGLPFVVTACIDRYALHLGPVRFLRRRWERPVLDPAVLTTGKRRLFAGPKVVVAGVSRRIEAARDDVGVALGVGVYAAVPRAVATELVLALLNSRAVALWYRRRFLGRELSGGYFAVNARHLRTVPVPVAWLDGDPEAARLIGLVRAREACERVGDDARREAECARLDAEIDGLVERALAFPEPRSVG